MGRSISLLLALAVLQACATTAPKGENAPPSGGPSAAPPPPPATPDNAAAKNADVGVEKVYRSSLSLCYDGALKVCRERDYRIRSQEKTAQAAAISAQGRSLDFTLAFTRTPENRTRVVLRVQGRTAPENRSEALAMLNKLSDTLLEPRD